MLKTFLQIYAETDEDRDPLDVSMLPANEALILAALRLRWPRVRGNENGGNVVLCLPGLRFSHPDHSGLPEAPPGVEEDRNHTRRFIACRRG